ncbi:DUF2247 family protein [Lactiplantibacillus plantarum]
MIYSLYPLLKVVSGISLHPLSKLNDEVTDDKKLLDEIEKFYDNQGYPEDMNTFIEYMPQDSYTNCKILILRFHEFLNLEGEQLRLI